MTTIAWDGKTLAGDRKATVNNTPTPFTKIWRAARAKDGARLLYGAAGDLFDCLAFRQWVEGGAKPAAPKNLSVMAIDDRRRIWFLSEALVWHRIDLPYWAVGSGADYALGAMAAKKTAAQAVRIANRFDVWSGLGVNTLTWRRP